MKLAEFILAILFLVNGALLAITATMPDTGTRADAIKGYTYTLAGFAVALALAVVINGA